MNKSTKYSIFVTLGVAILIMSIVLISLSLKKIPEGEVGIQYDDVSNTIHTTPLDPGLKTVKPDSKIITYPSRLENYDMSMICRTRDGIEINLQITFQYSFLTVGSELVASILSLGEKSANVDYMGNVAKGAIYESCSFFKAVNFTETRALVEFNMSKMVELSMVKSNTHTSMGAFQLKNFEYPVSFQTAINSKQKTKQQIVIVTSERSATLTDAETELQKEVKAVEIQINNANAQRQTLLDTAQLDAVAQVARWNQTILDLSAEYSNLGFSNFSEFILYKKRTLVEGSNNAVVNINP